MAPWLKANGKGKELASLWKSLVLPACDPKGFDSAAAAAGKGAAGPQLTLSMQLPATPSNSSSAAAARDATKEAVFTRSSPRRL